MIILDTTQLHAPRKIFIGTWLEIIHTGDTIVFLVGMLKTYRISGLWNPRVF